MKKQKLYLTRVNIIGCRSHLPLFHMFFKYGQWTGRLSADWITFKIGVIILYSEARLSFMKEHNQMSGTGYVFCIRSRRNPFTFKADLRLF